MTTAARPTFEPARGGQGRGEKDLSALSKQYSSRDLPGHTKLKYRQQGQGGTADLQDRDFRRELEEKEREYREKEKSLRGRLQDVPSKKPRFEALPAPNLDADDPIDDDSNDSDSDSDDESSELLLAELARIKKERAAEAARKEAERKDEEERIRMENIISGNPLLNYSSQAPKSDLKVKRRWDEDVVFKNCAKSEPKTKEFINDSLRSEFHKRFMEKYIK